MTHLIFDDKKDFLTLTFKGFSWDIETKIEFLNLKKKTEPLNTNLNCTCEYANEGGLCSHFWTGLIWIFQSYPLDFNRWQKTPLPKAFYELTQSLNYSDFFTTKIKTEDKVISTSITNVETLLKHKFMGKTHFSYEDMKELSIAEIRNFFEINNFKYPEKSGKPKKIDLINFIRERMDEKRFNSKFFDYKKNIRISEAKSILINNLKITWGPPLNSEADLKIIRDSEEEKTHITIKNNKIQHEDCHWRYHRSNFCEHLLALFLALAKKNEQKTLDFLENYV